MRHPYLVLGTIGLVLATWVVLGRGLFGLLGEYTQLYSMLLGIPIVSLHLLNARAISRTNKAGYSTRRGVWVALSLAWTCYTILGFTIPDKVDGSTHSILTGDTAGLVGMAIGISNPMGIIGTGMLVAALIMATQDARDPSYSEDDLLDQAEASSGDSPTA